MYTNIVDLISRQLEIKDYLNKDERNILWLTETKLSEDIQVKLKDSDNYNVCRKHRQGRKGGRVMIMVK